MKDSDYSNKSLAFSIHSTSDSELGIRSHFHLLNLIKRMDRSNITTPLVSDDVEEDTSFSVEQMEMELSEESVPPLSSFAPWCKEWLSFWMYPATFLLLNIVVFMSLVFVDAYEYQERFKHSYGSNKDAYEAMFRSNSITTAVVFFIDAIILFQATIYLEKQVAERDVAGVDENPTAHEYVHANVSRKMDLFLGRGRRPRMSIFVSLLYIATTVSCSISITSFTLWIFSNTSKAKDVCSPGRGHRKTGDRIEGLPDGLQDWARGLFDNDDPFMYREHQQNFNHMRDGTTFFVGTKPKEDQSGSYGERTILMSSGPNGTIESYKNILSPEHFTTIKGDSEFSSDSFCALFRDSRPQNSKILCVSSAENVLKGFRNATLYTSKSNWYDRVVGLTSYKEEFWTAILRESSRTSSDGGPFNRREVFTEFRKVDPETMNVVLVTNITESPEGSFWSERVGPTTTCQHWLEMIGSVICASILLPTGAWLYRTKQVTAGACLGCIAIYSVLFALSSELGIGLAFLVILGVSVGILGRFARNSDHEPLVWILYSTLVCVSVTGVLSGSRPMVAMIVVLYIAIGFLLNHPVLQILGWVGGTITMLVGIFSLIHGAMQKESQSHYYDTSRPTTADHILLITCGIIAGCGTVTIGSLLTKYRAYIVFYINHFLRAARESNFARRGGEEGLTRTLLQHGD